MKPRPILHHFLAAIGCATLAISSAFAASLTWDPASGGASDGAGAWLDTGKWWDGATNVDWTSGDDATFGNSGAGGAVSLASSTSAQSITFNAFTGTYTLGTSGNALTINGGITKTAGATAVFASPIILGGAQTWTNNSTGALTTGNGTNLIDSADNQLTVDGTGTFNFGVINNPAESLTGSGALVKNGTGRLNIGGVNSGFSGTITVNGGVLQVHNNNEPMGLGNLTLNGGVYSFYWGATYTRSLGTGDSQVQILGGESGFAGSGTTGPTINLGSVIWGANGEGSGATGFFNPSKFTLGDPGTGNAGTTTFASAIDLNGTTRTIVAHKGNSSSFNRSTISGAISNSTGTAGLIKEGGGYLLLSNSSSAWNGTTTVSAGFMDFGGINLANVGDGASRDITVAAGAIVRFNSLDNAKLNRIAETSDEFGIFTGGNGDVDFSSSAGANLPNAFLGSWAGNGAKREYNGVITPASDAYRIGYTGASGAFGVLQPLVDIGGTSRGLIVGGQSVVLVDTDNTFSGDTVIRNGGRLFIANNLALQNSALDTSTGLLSLHDTFASGNIVGAERSDAPTLGGIFGNRDFAAPFLTTANQNNTARLPLNQILGLTLNVATGKTFTWTGGLIESSAGTTLTKTGEGTQILDDTNTYTGATTISAGTLGLGASGSITASASVTIAAGATLDTSAQSSYAVPASQPVEFGIDAAGAGSSGKMVAAELDISNATVTYNIAGPLDDTAYVLATYTNLVGGAFLSVPAAPSGYELQYDYAGGTQIALVSTGAPAGFAAWQSANSTAGGISEDHDGDGVDNGTEFFLGGTANTTGFTALPGVDNTGGTLSVTWTKAADYTGAYNTDFVVETSATLQAGSWTTEDVAPNPGATVTITGNDVTYTFPAGTKNFVRLKVTGPN